MHDPDETVRTLSERVRVLESENARLVEQAEDATALGLIAEAVLRSERRDEVLAAGLEKVALLKQLPWAAYVRREPEALHLLASFAPERGELHSPPSLELPEGLRSSLDSGQTEVIDGARIPETWPLAALAGREPKPRCAVVWVPGRPERGPGRGFLFLVEGEPGAGLVPLLSRASDTMDAAVHRLELMASLAAYNRDLGADRLFPSPQGPGVPLEAAETVQRLLALVETVPDLVGCSDAVGRVTFINRAGRRLLGIGDGVDVRRCRLEEMHPAGKLDFLRETVLVGAVRDGVWEGEMPFRSLDGKTFPMWQILCVQRGDDGEVLGFFTVAHDLRAQRDLEAQLRQAQKMEALGTLVGGVAHDFNNLLAAVTGNLFLARTHLRDPRATEARLREIEELCFGATSLISRLLAFARKGPPAVLEPLDLRGVVSGAEGLVRATLREDIRLTIDPGPSSARVRGDAHQLQQALLNLVTNARLALHGRPDPAVEVRVDVMAPTASFRARHEYADARPLVRLTVRDNGCGIPEEVRPRIFDPFFTTRPPGHGTGLGLSMVYAAIQTHVGFVEVESEVGRGTAFHLFFPAEPAARSTATPPSASVAGGAGETVLVVDDEPSVRRTIMRVVQAIGYRSLEAADGREALQQLEERGAEIALVVMDVVMPNLSGPAVVRRLRRAGSIVPVVLVTGYRDRAFPPGEPLPTGTVLVQKPFSIPELSRTLRSLLRACSEIENGSPSCPLSPALRGEG